jgi:hypothetical protein
VIRAMAGRRRVSITDPERHQVVGSQGADRHGLSA